MVEKILRTVVKILLIILAYLLQIYVVNNNTFFGVTGDLCLMIVVLITLIEKNSIAYITAVACGITSDVLFSHITCKYLAIYIIVVSVLTGLKKIYKQDSKLAIIVFSIVGIMVSEVLSFIFNLVITGEFINIFAFVMNLFKQCIINIFLSFLLYLLFRRVVKEGK